MDGTSVVDRLSEVRARIAQAEHRAGRNEGDVKLVTASKTKPLEMIDEAARAGQRDFGENYVQEAIVKADARPQYAWHFIGSLQTNKVKDVVGRFCLIHAVDRLKLAQEISKIAVKKGVVQEILLQVHIGEEETKRGSGPAEIASLAREVAALPGISLRGLMCLPPLTEDPEIGRGYFRQLRELLEQIRRDVLPPPIAARFDILSMGTSGDYEWAILEGATHVRVGTSIFGSRSP